ncbi:erythromycin esterase family protein [Nonomuraea sp. NPDC050790]|uniref:erythromycin esterase family protein n=1 Tax=Nonomuraea sp. NPDC050790 TaxID=3364371 RepID=UPI0037A81ACA
MDIKDTARPLDGAGISAFLRSLPTRPALLGLGEPTHRVEEGAQVRNEMFRHLVEHEGYRSIALESDCLRGLVVDDYVTKGVGTLDEVMERGFSHGFGAFPANRELVRWMRAYNEENAEKIRFFGFDGPLEYWAESPRQALTALYDLLEEPLPCTRQTLGTLLGQDEPWSNEASAMDPAQSIGRSEEAQRLRLIADDLVAVLDTQAPRLSREDRDRARLYARTAVGLLRYHYWLADASPMRWTRLSSLRDAMMAANLRAIAERGPCLVFAHNLHLQRNRASMSFGDQTLEWYSAGAVAEAYLGDRYAFLAIALGTIGEAVPSPDTVEGALSELPWDHSLVDARRLAGALAEPARRVAHDHAYIPLDPDHLGLIDGIVFLRKTAHRTGVENW